MCVHDCATVTVEAEFRAVLADRRHADTEGACVEQNRPIDAVAGQAAAPACARGGGAHGGTANSKTHILQTWCVCW